MANHMEYLTSIRVDMYNVMKSYDNCFIHRAKCCALRSDFETFCKQTTSMLSDKSIVTPAEAQIFKQIIHQVGIIRDLFRDLSEQRYVETILEHELAYARNTIYDFKVKFNELVKQGKLSKTDACQMDEEQFEIDDHHDMSKLMNKIRDAINSGNLTEHQKTQLEEKLEEIGNFSKGNAEQDSARREAYLDQTLTPEDVQVRLAKFKKWELNYSDFVKQKKIGRGGFAEVYLGYHKTTGRVVAIKQLLDDPRTVRDVKALRREIKILSQLHHFAILPFVGVCLSPPYSIITEFMSNGSLHDRLRKGESVLDATKLTIIAMGIARGMAYLHEKKMLHRDLKPLNVLLDADDFPKICDFGVSRKMPENENSPLTFNPGTLQYMAPEVLLTDHYNEKADVYSYGILLWELFTRETPYQGMHLLQTAMKVANDNLRPVIPPNCPQPLAEVIKKCWSTDPEKRPSFDDIVKTFTYGKVSFPGTNPTALNNYMTQYLQGCGRIEHFDPDDASKAIACSLYVELDSASEKLEQAVAKVKMIADKPQWHPHILTENIVQRIIQVMQTCSEAQIAFNLVYSVYHLLKNEAILKEFVRLKGVSTIVDLFLRYGNTSMTNIIDCMGILVKVEDIIFNTEMLLKVSPFLVANDLTVRKTTAELINLVIERNAYDDEGSLTVVVANILANTIPEAMPDLLSVSLTLLKKLMTLPKSFTALVRYGGTATVFALTSHPDKSIQLDVLDLIRHMLAETNPPQQTVSMFIDGFAKLVTKGSNSDIQMKALIVLAVLLKSPSTFKEIAGNESAIRALVSLFQSSDSAVATYSLKLCYAFMSNATSYPPFVRFGKDMLGLLSVESSGISLLAAACLTALIQKSGVQDLLGENIKEFLNRSLSSESVLTHAGLRLSGVISACLKGARFLEQTKAIDKIVPFLESESPETKKLAIMVFASQSSSYPMSRAAVSALPTFFNELQNESLSPYPLITITNVTVNPQAAVTCCERLHCLLPLLDSKDELNTKRALTALHRIVTTREIRDLLTDTSTISELITYTEPHWCDEYSDIVFDIIEALSGIEESRNIIAKSKLPDYLIDQLETTPAGNHMRPLFMRILSRIGID